MEEQIKELQSDIAHLKKSLSSSIELNEKLVKTVSELCNEVSYLKQSIKNGSVVPKDFKETIVETDVMKVFGL